MVLVVEAVLVLVILALDQAAQEILQAFLPLKVQTVEAERVAQPQRLAEAVVAGLLLLGQADQVLAVVMVAQEPHLPFQVHL